MRQRFSIGYLTSDIPGTGGVIKAAPEDFLVEEVPLYEPDGQGPHLFVWIEKRGISTFDAARRIANACGISPREVGYAGLKDNKAVARQYLSVTRVSQDMLRSLAWDDLRVLDVRPHSRKLKMGHLAGNRFRVTVRGAAPGEVETARATVAVLQKRGVPNFYGPQRFGSGGRNVVIGRALVEERYNRVIQAFFAPGRDEEGSAVYEARRLACRGEWNRSLGLFPSSFIPERLLAIEMRRARLAVWYRPEEAPEPAEPIDRADSEAADSVRCSASDDSLEPFADDEAAGELPDQSPRAAGLGEACDTAALTRPSGRPSRNALMRAIRAIPKRYLEFYVSALQSALFNEVVRERFDTLDTVLDGDLAWIHGKGAVFRVEDAAAEAARAAAFEISPSGPIYGLKVLLADGAPGAIERSILEDAHLSLKDFRTRLGLKSKGVRRPLRVPLREARVEPAEEGFTVSFLLPKGAFATTVVGEIVKPDDWHALV